MKLIVKNIHIDPEGLEIKKHYHAQINIQGTLTIYDGDSIFFEETMFTVVELAEQLNNWLKTENDIFLFDTMDDEVENLLVFQPQSNGWKVTSAWQNQEYSRLVPKQELEQACKSFINTLKEKVRETLNVDLNKLCSL